MNLSPKAPPVSASSGEVSLSDAQLELINYFATLSERLSLPRSAGQIYGLLFGQPVPVPFEEIVRTLQISKGSASSSLKLLRGLKAIHPEHHLGDRRTFYIAETSVKNLVQALLEDGVKSHLKESESQLAAISALIPTNSRSGDSDLLAGLLHKRISSLQVWHRKTRKLIPWITRLTLPKRRTDD
jgi:DNA-binding transcriptional regulator GbsR (MarR family)